MAFDFTFTDAKRSAVLLRVLLCGESGHGKTFTALALAHHLGVDPSKIAAIDSETHEMHDRTLRGSLEKYQGIACECHRCRGHGLEFGTFAQLKLPPDKRGPRDYVEAIRAAGRAGFELLIIDSISHEWDECKALVDVFKKQLGGNQWAAWSKITPLHDEFVQAMMDFPGHVIACARGKEKTMQEGRKVTSRGLLPLQREGIEFEFDVWLNLIDATAHVAKTRANRLRGPFRQPGQELAEELLAWASGPTASEDREAAAVESEARKSTDAEDVGTRNVRRDSPPPPERPAVEAERPAVVVGADYIITKADIAGFAKCAGRPLIPGNQAGFEVAGAPKAQAIICQLSDDDKRAVGADAHLLSICKALKVARAARKSAEDDELVSAAGKFRAMDVSKIEMRAATKATETPNRRAVENYSASELRTLMMEVEIRRDRITDALNGIGADVLAGLLRDCAMSGPVSSLSPADAAVLHDAAVQSGAVSVARVGVVA